MLVFILLYVPCVAAVSTLFKELGSRAFTRKPFTFCHTWVSILPREGRR